MKSVLRRFSTALVLIFLLTSPMTINGAEMAPSNEPVTYSAEAVQEDLASLYETLQASTYDLFLNTSKTDYDKAFERAMASITGPMTYLEISRLFRPFVVRAGFVHCWSGFPSEAYQQFHENGGRLIPFDISFWEGKVLLSANWSDNGKIEAGDEILAINGTDIHQLLEKLYTYQQGESEYVKRTLLETRGLKGNWWFVFGDFSSGTVRLRKPDGQQIDTEVKGITLEQFKERQKAGGSPSFMKDGRTFKFIGDVAYLRPGDFLNAETQDISTQEAFDNTEFLDFIDSAFREIARKKAQHLILDLRGNYGGDNSFSDPMIAYFADKPFRIASKFSVRTSQVTKSFWKDVNIPELAEMKQQIMTLEDGSRFEVELAVTQPRTDDLAFKGEVITLVDRFSFSNTSAVAAIVQDYEFGVLVGEETSDTPSSCGALHTFNLPNTEMLIFFPKACMTRPSGDPSLRGVIPDHVISDNPFTEEDEILDAALQLIQNG
ncbi:MAG: S41 family peptidase [Xanthomonadales bacterium]|jgi:C-terminal processing protease CtpA/Prc|nr:S41 family peptidase [Xanthomonadales bacterium]